VKIHLHETQFDGAPHPRCGRGSTAVEEKVFEATAPALRCQHCDREWFPDGQPDWHLEAARKQLSTATQTQEKQNMTRTATQVEKALSMMLTRMRDDGMGYPDAHALAIWQYKCDGTELHAAYDAQCQTWKTKQVVPIT
jgi:hypothetical protein